MANISTFKIGTSGEVQNFKDVVSDATKYLVTNESGNLELSNNVQAVEAGSKINIVAKNSIQLKPGMTKKSKNGSVVIDNEFATNDPLEAKLDVCNGRKDPSEYENPIIGLKVNVGRWTFDSKGVNEDIEESAEDFQLRFQQDKWKIDQGKTEASQGPIRVKLKARSFDLRCHNHGGIALQPCGCDSENLENKIKFESSRTSKLGAETSTWGAEGGKGLEFGTFNNAHSSLYTGDYRFRANAPVYAVVRENPKMPSGSDKFDYPTQDDDFKDILPTETAINWADVINVVRYIKTLEDYQTWLVANKLTVAAVGVDGFDSNNMKCPTHTVSFSCQYGSVSATVDGMGIQSGESVLEGKTVIFTITPDEGYRYVGTNPESVVVNADVTKSYECTPVTP